MRALCGFRGEEVADEDDPTQHRGRDQEAGGDVLARPVADEPAQQTCDQRPDEREEYDGLNHEGQPFSELTSSTAMVPRLR
jgi:hypothetical protein